MLAWPATTGDRRLVVEDGRTVYGLVWGPYQGPDGADPALAGTLADGLRHALPAGTTVQVTGLDALRTAAAEEPAGTGVLVETLAGALGALVVLAFVFGSFLALVPLLIAAVAILTTFLAVLGLTGLVEVSFIVQFLIALIGLGVAVDYSLLVVTRWREELPRPRPRAGRPPGHGHRRPGGGDQRRHRGRGPAGPGPAPGAVPAQHRLRRPAHPAGDPGHPDPAAGAAGHRRPRLDWPASRRARAFEGGARPAALDRLGRRGGPPPLAGHPGRAGRASPWAWPPSACAWASRRPPSSPSPARPARPSTGWSGPASAAASSPPSRCWSRPAPTGRTPGRGRRGQLAVAPAGPAWQRDDSGLVSVLAAETSGDAGEATVERVRDLTAAELGGARVEGSGALAIDATPASTAASR